MNRRTRTEECLLLSESLERSGIYSTGQLLEVHKKLLRLEAKTQLRHASAYSTVVYLKYIRQLEYLHHLKVKDPCKTEHHCTSASKAFKRLIFSTLRHALTRFHADIGLWLLFLKYCSHLGAHKVVSRGLTKALRLNSHSLGLWTFAVSWEFQQQLNPFGARVLLQRALRTCPKTKELWRWYFEFELKYTDKLRERKYQLTKDSDDQISVTCADETPITIFDGALAAGVYEAAKAHYQNFGFLMYFLVQTYQIPWAKNLKSYIYTDLLHIFPKYKFELDLVSWESGSLDYAPILECVRSSSNTVENSNAIVAKLKKRASSHEETRAFRVCFDNLLGLSARSILQQACGHMRNILELESLKRANSYYYDTRRYLSTKENVFVECVARNTGKRLTTCRLDELRWLRHEIKFTPRVMLEMFHEHASIEPNIS